MFKRILLVALIVMMAVSAYAADNITLQKQTLSSSSITTTSDTITTRNYQKMTFYVYQGLIGTGQATYYLDQSYDGSSWFTGYFRTTDMADTAPTITSSVLTSDTSKVAFFPNGVMANYVRSRTVPSISAGSNYIYETLTMVGQ